MTYPMNKKIKLKIRIKILFKKMINRFKYKLFQKYKKWIIKKQLNKIKKSQNKNLNNNDKK